MSSIRYKPRIRSINHGKFDDETMLLGGAPMLIVNIFKSNLEKFLKASRRKKMIIKVTFSPGTHLLRKPRILKKLWG